ncbi:MAG TPA: SDR family NAD(P)-dependent oxidoreductase [Acidimicrobiales bacterium]|jgi:3-oxoacyl-[acyl-carrier protein] reductase|nr:SDR family NAD(P)-dependent oxidoreductase [Acidimicrobiales bacterium]
MSTAPPVRSGALHDRVALVTGSSRGIGRAIAAHLAQEGATVAVHGRDEAAVATVVGEIETAGGRALATTADLTRAAQIEALRDRIEGKLGPVDIVVANAGGSPVPPGPLEDIAEDDWRASVDSNLTATFLTVKAFLPGMKRRGRGVVITMSSAAARRPTERSPMAYAAAKAGIEVLTKELALQAGPHGVRVNCLAPETILTERNRQQIPPEVQEQLAATHPIRRLGTPEDVAEAAAFLASDQSSWITGITIDVAGGSVLA